MTTRDPATTKIYHITDVENLPAILKQGGLISDMAMSKRGGPDVQIGYDHIKARRLTEIQVDCCDDKFVGEFVPFYYCPRSVMLFTVNRGATGRPKGCQESIIHLVSTVALASSLDRQWAISDGNAGARSVTFSSNHDALGTLDWKAIEAQYWSGLTFEKQAEFLVEEFFPVTALIGIGCHNDATTRRVERYLQDAGLELKVKTLPGWYYP